MKRWYAIKIVIGKEEAVERQLKNAGLEVLNPKYGLWERKGGRWQEKEKYLLSGYVLIQTVMTAERYYLLKNMWYVSYVLKGAVTEAEVMDIKSCLELAQTSTIEYRQNKIMYSGAIKDNVQRIIKVDRRKQRVLLSFELGGEVIERWLPVKIIYGAENHQGREKKTTST